MNRGVDRVLGDSTDRADNNIVGGKRGGQMEKAVTDRSLVFLPMALDLFVRF